MPGRFLARRWSHDESGPFVVGTVGMSMQVMSLTSRDQRCSHVVTDKHIRAGHDMGTPRPAQVPSAK